MSRLLIENALRIVTMDECDRVLAGGFIAIDGCAISSVGRERPAGPFDRVIDASGCVVTPGLINTHHHLYQTLQRVVPFVQDAALFDWLTGLYEIWRELTPNAVYTSALVGLGELLLSGCTTVADHFYVFPRTQPATLLDETIRAARDAGVRFHPTRGSMSRGRSAGGLPPDDVVQDARAIHDDSVRVVDAYHDPAPFSMCRVGLAPCSPFSVTEDLLRGAAEIARTRGVRLHTHLAETVDEEHYCLKTHGVRPLEFLDRLGWLGRDVWLAHGIHFNDAEIDRLAETGTGVAHCPTSNLRLGSGIARVPEMIARGVPVGLAVDGSASNDGSNLLREVRLAALVHRVGTGVDRMPAMTALALATRGSARVLGRDDIGVLSSGKAADVAIYSMQDIGYAGAMHDPVAALVLCAGPDRARTVVVNGDVVVDGGRLLKLDEVAVAREADAIARRMLDAMAARTGRNPLARVETRARA